MKKLKKLTLTELAKTGTVDQILSAQNLNELQGGGVYVGGSGGGTIGISVSISIR